MENIDEIWVESVTQEINELTCSIIIERLSEFYSGLSTDRNIEACHTQKYVDQRLLEFIGEVKEIYSEGLTMKQSTRMSTIGKRLTILYDAFKIEMLKSPYWTELCRLVF